MNTLRLSLSSFLIFGLCCCCVAQLPDVEADHEALRQLRHVFEEAVNSNNLQLLEPYLAPKFSIVTFTDREFTDFAAFSRQWQSTRQQMLGGTGSYRMTLRPELSELYGDIAVCRGDSDNVMVDDDGNEFHFTAHWTAVCQRSDGHWKIVRGHNSLQPFTNPMLRHAVQRLVTLIVVTSLIVGCLIGAGVWMLVLYRRRSRD